MLCKLTKKGSIFRESCILYGLPDIARKDFIDKTFLIILIDLVVGGGEFFAFGQIQIKIDIAIYLCYNKMNNNVNKTKNGKTMTKKLLIFDLDGTIADTIYSIRDGVNLTMQKYGLHDRTYEDTKRFIGNGARELMRLCVPEWVYRDAELFDRVLADYDAFYGQTYDRVETCYDGMESTLRTLKARGYLLAVLSNKQDEYVKKIMDILFEKDFFSDVRGQTELPRKPDPTVPHIIADSLGVPYEDCAFIGDSDVDVLTGKNASMMTVGCSWGYRPRAALADADAIVDSPLEILDIFE